MIDNQFTDFYAAQAVYIKKAIPDAQSLADGEPFDAFQNDIHEQWLDWAGGAGVMDRMTLEDALSSFQVWLVQVYLSPKEKHSEYLEVYLQRDWGGVTAAVRIGTKVDVGTGKQRSAALDLLWKAADSELARFGDRHMSSTPSNPPMPSGSNGAGQASTETIDCERLSIEVKDGRRLAKVHGGRYRAHGVRVWPETLEKIGIILKDVPLEGKNLQGWTARLKMKAENKPDKVIAFFKED